MFKKKTQFVEEEGIKLFHFGNKISKELEVFYNPDMKLNRDTSLLFINSYFNEPILYCDPMAASGIREMRFVKTIPHKFSKLVCGDISKTALNTMKKHCKINKLPTKKISFMRANALNTLSSQYFHMIELDPFGTPVPFLDTALQRIKHNGILTITATDTAALCGTYPRTGLRRYAVKSEFMFWYEEFGLRALIGYCQREAAKYDKSLSVKISFTAKHFYKIIFKVEESKTQALRDIKALKYIHWDRKTQEITTSNFEEKDYLGKIYTGSLNNKDMIEKMKKNLNLLEEQGETQKFLDKLAQEIDTLGYYNPHKLQRAYKFHSSKKFDDIIKGLEEKGFQASRPHNNRLGIKTTATSKDIISVMRE